MVPVDSRRVSRAPRYSGIRFESSPFSPTRLSRSMAALSSALRLTAGLGTLLLRTLQPLPDPKVVQVWAISDFARHRLWIHRAVIRFCRIGFPHSEIPGSKPACGYPGLIAACHVLLRLLLPRHPPCALSSLTIKFAQRRS